MAMAFAPGKISCPHIYGFRSSLPGISVVRPFHCRHAGSAASRRSCSRVVAMAGTGKWWPIASKEQILGCSWTFASFLRKEAGFYEYAVESGFTLWKLGLTF
ncbi:hypothetical protein HPP92_026030 [Vanilla planifolia]|uniref:Uncharacterized protein n=1 Tax=Vanilla planifolia TaxID=51239 RepID=A0A835PGF5_VANPL|nr:hypothetical protein HPP92_026030 [Vanilla planifolia]